MRESGLGEDALRIYCEGACARVNNRSPQSTTGYLIDTLIAEKHRWTIIISMHKAKIDWGLVWGEAGTLLKISASPKVG